jgi:hypothetical protein
LLLNLEETGQLNKLNAHSKIFIERHSDRKLQNILISPIKARGYFKYLEEMIKTEDPYDRMTIRDLVWKLKRNLVRKRISPNHHITPNEEDLYCGLPLWILENPERRRLWTKKISQVLLNLESQKLLLTTDGQDWTYAKDIKLPQTTKQDIKTEAPRKDHEKTNQINYYRRNLRGPKKGEDFN